MYQVVTSGVNGDPSTGAYIIVKDKKDVSSEDFVSGEVGITGENMELVALLSALKWLKKNVLTKSNFRIMVTNPYIDQIFNGIKVFGTVEIYGDSLAGEWKDKNWDVEDDLVEMEKVVDVINVMNELFAKGHAISFEVVPIHDLALVNKEFATIEKEIIKGDNKYKKSLSRIRSGKRERSPTRQLTKRGWSAASVTWAVLGVIFIFPVAVPIVAALIISDAMKGSHTRQRERRKEEDQMDLRRMEIAQGKGRRL